MMVLRVWVDMPLVLPLLDDDEASVAVGVVVVSVVATRVEPSDCVIVVTYVLVDGCMVVVVLLPGVLVVFVLPLVVVVLTRFVVTVVAMSCSEVVGVGVDGFVDLDSGVVSAGVVVGELTTAVGDDAVVGAAELVGNALDVISGVGVGEETAAEGATDVAGTLALVAAGSDETTGAAEDAPELSARATTALWLPLCSMRLKKLESRRSDWEVAIKDRATMSTWKRR